MFNITEYIKRNLIGGFSDGTFSESKVMQIAIGYLTKGILTEEDIESIDSQIQTIKIERERTYDEVIEENLEDAEMQTYEFDAE